ncbi:MAG: hypothetical protein QGH37_23890, partial [Candidatus Poribacteria bacterium]|nr:hypothetical protein [Candidatus Poribacteria bacterium]
VNGNLDRSSKKRACRWDRCVASGRGSFGCDETSVYSLRPVAGVPGLLSSEKAPRPVRDFGLCLD